MLTSMLSRFHKLLTESKTTKGDNGNESEVTGSKLTHLIDTVKTHYSHFSDWETSNEKLESN